MNGESAKDKFARIKAEQEAKKKEAAAETARMAAEKMEAAKTDVEKVRAEFLENAEKAEALRVDIEGCETEDTSSWDEEAKASAKEIVDGMKAEEMALLTRSDELLQREAALEAEIASLGGGEAASAEEPIEAAVSEDPAVEAPAEAPAETGGAPKEVMFGAEEMKKLIDSAAGAEPKLAMKLEEENSVGDYNPAKNKLARITEEGLQELRAVYDKHGENPDLDKFPIMKEWHGRMKNMIDCIQTFIDIRNKPDFIKQTTEGALETMKTDMPNKGRIELARLIQDSKAIPGAAERLAQEIGTKPLDILQEKKNQLDAKLGAEGRPESAVFNQAMFHDIPNITSAMETVDPAQADAYHEFFAKGMVESFKGKKPDEVRQALLTQGSNASVYRELGLVFDRMKEGKDFSEGAGKAIAEMIQILEESDKVEQVKGMYSKRTEPVKGESEFLTDSFVERVSEAKYKKPEEKQRIMSTIRESIKALKDKYSK
ncbi:MAG: hypothetical protein NTW66_02970 [Candidatus Magasanikbacteria bacterium]|nr:hypothetical protein [Candidatus Magasanikbacteria bacterium]